MSLTLFETFRQLDPNVKFTDGTIVETAASILARIDRCDPAEYVLMSDAVGRFVIYRLDFSGRAMFPPVYVEAKSDAPHGTLAAILPKPRDFGASLHGFV
jgi:hypothetical protein